MTSQNHMPANELPPSGSAQQVSLVDTSLRDGMSSVSHKFTPSRDDVVRLQIFLDEQNFGPGRIDGGYGGFTKKSWARYQESQGLTPVEEFDASNPKFEFGKKPDIEPGSLIVMDESSMIPDELFWFLMNQVEAAGAKIIFLGDGAQLAPVGQEKLSAAIADPSIKRAELTEVKRAKNAALLGESVYVREHGKFTNTPTMQNRNGVAAQCLCHEISSVGIDGRGSIVGGA